MTPGQDRNPTTLIDTIRGAAHRSFLVASISVASTHLPSSAQTIAIENTTVVPMDREQILQNHTVIVQDGRIVSVSPSDSTDTPDGAQRIDGIGQFLILGLTDMHIHLNGPRSDSEHLLRMYLAMGVTTVAVLNGSPLVLQLREAAAKGNVLDVPQCVAGRFRQRAN